MRDFTCAGCRKNEQYKKRLCMRYEELRSEPGDPFIPIPIFDGNGKPQLDDKRQEIRELRQLSIDEFLGELWHIQRAMPDMSTYQICTIFFKRICPESFVDATVERLIEAESEASSYRIDISDPEVRYEMLEFDMSLGDLLEAFTIVRGTRHAFERHEMEEQARKNQ